MSKCSDCTHLECETVHGDIKFREGDYELYRCGAMRNLVLPKCAESSNDDVLYRFIMMKREALSWLSEGDIERDTNCFYYKEKLI